MVRIKKAKVTINFSGHCISNGAPKTRQSKSSASEKTFLALPMILARLEEKRNGRCHYFERKGGVFLSTKTHEHKILNLN